MFNMFSGGALERASLFALGVMPYIRLDHRPADELGDPKLEQLRKEARPAPQDHAVHRYGTLGLAIFQAIGISVALQASRRRHVHVVTHGPGFVFTATVSLVTGTMS